MKFWRRKQNEDDFDDWEYPFEEKKQDRAELKKCAAAALIFALAYACRSVDAPLGDAVDRQLRRLVTEHTDVSYLANRMQGYLPEEWRGGALLERVQGVLAHPADPLRYMSAPSDGALMSGFAPRGAEAARGGIEYRSDFGAPVRAAGRGEVKRIGTDAKLGRFVVLAHGRDMETVYGYLAEILVAEGERVEQRQEIARSGRRPEDREEALYFALREHQTPVDPAARLPRPSAGGGAD